MGGQMQQPYMPEHTPTFARADLKAETFDVAIKQRGFRVLWEQSILCSCISEDSGQPDYNCPVCKGKGHVFFDAKETKVLVSSISGRKDFEHIGMNEQGTAYITPLSTDMVGFRDRFTFLDFTVKFSDVLTRGYTEGDALKYPAFDIVSLRNLSKVFLRGKDFNISEDSWQIEWINKEIVPGERYSILYTTNPVYVAISPIHELRGTYSMYKGQGEEYFVNLPSQYMIKREDMIHEGQL